MSAPFALSYEADLSPFEIDAALEQLLHCQRRCEWLLCRYLADMADNHRFRQVGWYSDVLHYARIRFDLSVKSTRERVRIGRALRQLPRIEQAFVAGTLSYSKVRELTRVAKADSDSVWLELGLVLSQRDLERRVAGEVGATETCDRPAETRWVTPETVELKMKLPAPAWALLSRAMQGARLAAEAPMTDAEALEAVAREALAGMTEPDAVSIADPRRAVVLYRCEDCSQTELETTAGAVALSPAQADALCCGARPVDLSTEGFAEACVGGCIPAAIRRAVLARDRGRCRVCGRRRYVDVHHLQPQSEGGAHSRDNCCVLCTTCHAALHDGKLRIEGTAEGALRWFDEHGREMGSEAHAAPGEARAGPSLSTEATGVLRAMGGRGGWHSDALVDAAGLTVSQVSVALLELELAGKVRQEGWGTFSPVESSNAPMGASGQAATHCDAPMGASGQPQTDSDAPMGASAQRSADHEASTAAHAGQSELHPDPTLSPEASHVLEVMNGQGGWMADALVEQTSFSVSQVMMALTELQLGARVYPDGVGTFAPSTPSRRRAPPGACVPTARSKPPSSACDSVLLH